MEREFQIGDKVHIRPGTSHCRWGWTNRLKDWAREGKVLKVVGIEWENREGRVIVEANNRTQCIEPKSLRHVNWPAIDPALVPGDSVRIKPDYSGFLFSLIAEQEWKPDGTVLKLRSRQEYPRGFCTVEWLDRDTGRSVIQTIPFDSIERVPAESHGAVEKPARKIEVLVNLEQGAIFSDNGDLCMKTDEIEEDTGSTTYYRCVVLTGEHTGLIVYLSGDKAVALDPNADVVPALDPWEQAKVYYGDLQPGDMFRDDRGDRPSRVCAVLKKKNGSGGYYSMKSNGDVINYRDRLDTVYRDDILIEHGV